MSDSTAVLDRPTVSVGRRVTRDSIWILCGYAVTSLSGFIFWVLAARLITPAELGVDTAIYSVFTAAASIAASGIGNALLVMISSRPAAGKALLRLGGGVVVALSATTGTIAGLGVVLLIAPGETFAASALSVAGVAFATVLWSLFVIKDPIITAIGGARWLLLLNGPVNVAKLALLPLAVAAVAITGNPVVVSALLPAAIGVTVAFVVLIPRGLATARRSLRGTDAPAGTQGDVAAGLTSDDRRHFATFALRDGTANGLYMGSALLLPFLVTAIAGGEQGALFALCFQIGMVLDLVVISVGTSLVTHVAGDKGLVGPMAFKVWLFVLGVVAVGAACLILFAPFLLGLLGEFYAASSGATVLTLMAIGSVLRTAYEVWCSMLRADSRTTPILIVSIVSAALLIPAAAVAAGSFGAVGVAVVLVLVTAGQSLVGLTGLLKARRKVLPA